jgi:ornithine cyclodeaminase/alanine dehydrogenase
MKLAVLGRQVITQVLDMALVIDVVDGVYRDKAAGRTAVWPSVEYRFDNGGVMDIRSGYVGGAHAHGAKLLNNFPGNTRLGLPAFSGLLMLFDSETGIPQAVVDASYITSMRTGAAAALGVRALARDDATRLLLVGSGYQAIFMLAAVLTACPRVTHVDVYDPLDFAHARVFAQGASQRLAAEFGLPTATVRFAAVPDGAEALRDADAVVTVTRATEPVIRADWVGPGTHLSCIGADMHGKQELDPVLFASARIFADDVGQCTRFGEMELAVERGIITAESVHGELGEVLSGVVPGRCHAADITIFDATGLALLDIACARVALTRADEAGLVTRVQI